MHARIVTTKERKYGDLVRREGSPVPGVELFDPVDGNLHISIIKNTNFQTKYNFPGREINIASLLLREGHALEDSKSFTSSKPASPSPPTVGPPPSAAALEGNASPPSSTFSAIVENTTNENTQNTQIDRNHTKLNSHSFIEAEKRQMLQKQMQNGQTASPPAPAATDLTSKTNSFVMQQQATSTW